MISIVLNINKTRLQLFSIINLLFYFSSIINIILIKKKQKNLLKYPVNGEIATHSG